MGAGKLSPVFVGFILRFTGERRGKRQIEGNSLHDSKLALTELLSRRLNGVIVLGPHVAPEKLPFDIEPSKLAEDLVASKRLIGVVAHG